jgi:hypothetical protein
MKHLRQIDYACIKGERIWFPTFKGEKLEGIIKEWKDNIAVVQLDDGTIKEIEC